MNFFKPIHYLTFTKTPGLRLTEIKLESAKHLVKLDVEDKLTFKLLTLCNKEKLDAKNCLLEVEIFSNNVKPKNLRFDPVNVFI